MDHSKALAYEVREFLKTVIDEGTKIHTLGSDGIADIYLFIDNIEYHIQISRSLEHRFGLVSSPERSPTSRLWDWFRKTKVFGSSRGE